MTVGDECRRFGLKTTTKTEALMNKKLENKAAVITGGSAVAEGTSPNTNVSNH
jgi:hypothetical protein